MTDRELMQMALNALEECYDVQAYPANGETIQDDAIKSLRARLAQPETYPENFIDALRFEAALAQPEPEPKVEPEQSTTVAERDKVAKWMVKHGYATGHGDTIEDLLAELDWQIKEKNGV